MITFETGSHTGGLSPEMAAILHGVPRYQDYGSSLQLLNHLEDLALEAPHVMEVDKPSMQTGWGYTKTPSYISD